MSGGRPWRGHYRKDGLVSLAKFELGESGEPEQRHMNSGKTLLFAQVMEFVPWTSVARIVARYSGDARVSTLRSQSSLVIVFHYWWLRDSIGATFSIELRWLSPLL